MFDRFPKYTNGLPGHDWDVLTVEFSPKTVKMMEEDVLALLRYELERPKKEESTAISDSWLFRPGLVFFSDEETDLSIRIYDRMLESGSWILAVAGEYVMALRNATLGTLLAAIKSALNAEEHSDEGAGTLAERMERKNMRKACNWTENEVLTLAAKNLSKMEAAGDISRFLL